LVHCSNLLSVCAEDIVFTATKVGVDLTRQNGILGDATPMTMHRSDRYGGTRARRRLFHGFILVDRAILHNRAAIAVDSRASGGRDNLQRVRACFRGVSVSICRPSVDRRDRLDSTLSTPDPNPFAALVVALRLVAMPSFSLPQFDGRRVRSYLFRLPLCTRALLVVIVSFWIASLRLSWFQQWAALIPNEMNLGTSISYPSSTSRCCLSDHCRSVPT
ncbi:hypothetical protein KCU98_g272, partial [Aureobasidium melanogenum]